MAGSSDGAGGRRYRAEELAGEISREARELAELAREEDDYNAAWRIARERIGVLLQLGVVDASGVCGVTFEEIARLADEAAKDG